MPRVLLLFLLAGCSDGAPALRIATTTSVENSGLMDHLGQRYRTSAGVRLDVLAVGSGKALELAARGDVTCVIAHAPEAEELFVRRTDARRAPVFSNRFVIVGPDSGSLMDGPFASRGDRSGTHERELQLWKERDGRPRGYVQTGRGMAPTLDYAFEKGAFTLTDTATFEGYPKKKHLVLREELDRNVYSILVVAGDSRADSFFSWLTSDAGRAAVESYRIDGKQVFEPTWTSSEKASEKR